MLKELFEYKDLRETMTHCLTAADIVNMSACSKSLQIGMSSTQPYKEIQRYISLLDMKQTKISLDPDIASVFVLRDKDLENLEAYFQEKGKLPAALFKDYDVVASYEMFEYVTGDGLGGLMQRYGSEDYVYGCEYAAFIVLKPLFYKYYDKWISSICGGREDSELSEDDEPSKNGELSEVYTHTVAIDFVIGEAEQKDLFKYRSDKQTSTAGDFIVSKFKYPPGSDESEYLTFIEMFPRDSKESMFICEEYKKPIKYVHCVDSSLSVLSEMFLEMGIVKKDEPVLIYHPERYSYD